MIALNKLTTGYISKEISKDLDLTIEKGTLVGVLGSNGIGKSTLLKTLAGFENPLNGTITIDGKDIHEMSPIDRAKNLSIVLTERSLSGDLLGKEVIQLGRQPYTNWIGSQKAKDRELVSETIEQMNIGPLADRKLKTMSDGEIQKILLARALAQNTAIVLLDEPSANLDLYNKALLFQQIKKIVSLKQKTILFTSHDLNSAIQICDKILLLLADKWEFGTPYELIQRGVFQTVFPEETVGFDPLQKQFKICI
jgi:iron complex transport system ATP-binding protein